MVKKQEVAPVAAVPPMESSAVRVDSYHGNAPLALAEEIESALARYALGAPRRLFPHLQFFEGELAMIAAALRQMR